MKNPISVISKFISKLGDPKRSDHWPVVRHVHLQLEPNCQYCGNTLNLEVHHIKPFHLNPELELDQDNLITLCETMGIECHLKHGHFGNWKSFNPVIRIECEMESKGCKTSVS